MKPATTVTKLCRVMEQFQERPSFGITDLARRTELLPSDVHRILTSLRAFVISKLSLHESVAAEESVERIDTVDVLRSKVAS